MGPENLPRPTVGGGTHLGLALQVPGDIGALRQEAGQLPGPASIGLCPHLVPPSATPRRFEIVTKNRDLAESLGWDPHARGGRPELTPWEYIEQRNEKAEREARDLAESLGWDPDARGGRPELTPWEYIDQHNAEVGLGNIRALVAPKSWPGLRRSKTTGASRRNNASKRWPA